METPDDEIARLQRLRRSLRDEAAQPRTSTDRREAIAAQVTEIDEQIERAVDRSLAWRQGPASCQVVEGFGCAVMAATAAGINFVATSGDGYYRLFLLGVAFGVILVALGFIKSARYWFEERRIRRRRAAGLPHPSADDPDSRVER